MARRERRHNNGHCTPRTRANPYARRKWGEGVKIRIAPKKDIQRAVQEVFSERYLDAAVFDLANYDPVMSAQTVFTPVQLVVAWALVTATAIGLAVEPIATLIVINLVMTVFYLGNFLFKSVLIWYGGKNQHASERRLDTAVSLLRNEDLPIYTVLVPMFREPDVLPILANALRELDYPTSRLDIKIVLEEGDQLTIDAATALGLEDIFEIILVPPSQPQTKPKACN